MKKLLAVLAAVLLGVYVVFFVLGFKGDYDAQRDLWGIKRDFELMAARPESTPDSAARRLVDRFQKHIDTHPKSVISAKAQIMLGNVYMLKKDYAKGRAEIQKLPGVYAEDKELLAQAWSIAAKSYLMENNWPGALAVYQEIITDYPLTSVGFSTPMLIPRYYESKGMKTKANEAYEEAVVFYRGIAQNNPKSKYEYNSLRAIAMCRIAQKRWKGAVTAIRDLMLKYPTGPVLRESLYAVNAISITKLHDYDLAMNVYKQFMAKHPRHSVVPVMEKMMLNLEVLKATGVVTVPKPK